MKNKTNLYIAEAGIIAALYFAMTWVSNIAGLAFGQIQFRLSEILCILPVFTPAAIPGLTIGCLLSNFLSPMGWIDWVVGTSATLLASLTAYLLRKVKIFKLPVLSSFMPVLFNGVFVGAEISYFFPAGTRFAGFWASFLWVGLGEVVMCMLGGLILYAALERSNFSDVLKGNKRNAAKVNTSKKQ